MLCRLALMMNGEELTRVRGGLAKTISLLPSYSLPPASVSLRGPLPPFLAWYHYDRDERRRRSSIPVSNSTLALLFALSLSPLRDSSREAELWRILCRILDPPRPPPHSMICLRTQRRRTMNEALLDTLSPPFPFSLSPSHSLFLLFLSFLRALPDRPT